MSGLRRRRSTPQRRAILAELQASTRHPTAAEIYAAVRERLPRISLGTVYRNLDVLHADGLIRKLEHAGGDARYDACLRPHDHVRCTVCGLVRDMPGGVPPPAASLPADEIDGIAVTGYRLEFLGVCRACREQAAPAPTRGP